MVSYDVRTERMSKILVSEKFDVDIVLNISKKIVSQTGNIISLFESNIYF